MLNALSLLENRVLKGYFKRSEKTKQEGIKGLDLSKLNTEQQEILNFMNQNFDFEVKVLDFNLESGMFIARGDDIFGQSILYGVIEHISEVVEHGQEMKLKKEYIGKSRHGQDVARANLVDYRGWLYISPKGEINCSGTYETHPNSPENGVWGLSSIKDSA